MISFTTSNTDLVECKTEYKPEESRRRGEFKPKFELKFCQFRRYLTRRHSSSQKFYSNDSSVDKAKSGHKIKKIYIVWRIKKIKPVLEVKWTVFKVTKRRTVSAPLYPPLNSIISSQI